MTDYNVNFEYNFENFTLVDAKIEMHEVDDIMKYIDSDVDISDVLNIQIFSHSLGYDIFVQVVNDIIEYKVKRDTNAWYVIKDIKKKYDNIERVI